MAKDLYQILGVGRDASDAEIKKKYRDLAKKHHPDLHPGDSVAEQRFKELSQAYAILGDKDKRGQYDRGEIDESGAEKPEQQYYRQYADADSSGKYHSAQGFGGPDDLGDILDGLFGGRGRGNARHFRMKGGDVRYHMTVDFLEAANGAKKRVTMPDGRALDITVPAGFRDGQQLRLKGQGQPGTGGGEAGDAYVTIAVEPHPFFERRGDDVHVTVPVTLKEAALGAKVKVPTISAPVTLSVPAHSNSGTVLRLRGKGFKRKDGAGDQLVRLEIVLPEKPDKELTDFLESWTGGDANPRAKLGV
ncbi:MAG: J domain-containing protein [Bauldia litoralis]